MTTNFLQHNPGAANQENDTAYNADATRTGGLVVNQIVASNWMNKLLFQTSTMVAALGQMLSGKGYSNSDANLATLVSVLNNLLTAADLTPAALGFTWSFTGSSGWIKFPGGIMLQVAQGTLQSVSGTTQTINWPVAFPNNIYGVLVGCINASPNDTNMSFFQEVSRSKPSVTVWMQRNADHAYDPITPVVWGIGN